MLDGSGGPGIRADVAVTGDRIAEIGDGVDANGARELDASGQVVAPGFIDIHTHYDAQVFWDPALTPSSWHGVTTRRRRATAASRSRPAGPSTASSSCTRSSTSRT